jgi:hypothetical protein
MLLHKLTQIRVIYHLNCHIQTEIHLIIQTHVANKFDCRLLIRTTSVWLQFISSFRIGVGHTVL